MTNKFYYKPCRRSLLSKMNNKAKLALPTEWIKMSRMRIFNLQFLRPHYLVLESFRNRNFGSSRNTSVIKMRVIWCFNNSLSKLPADFISRWNWHPFAAHSSKNQWVMSYIVKTIKVNEPMQFKETNVSSFWVSDCKHN